MILLKRKETLSFEEFKDHWLHHHAVLVKQLPGLRKAVFNFDTSDGTGQIDAVSELWFDSKEDFTRAYASEIGQQVAADSLSRVATRTRVLVEEHGVV
ncbi:MAG: EthD family reductase [Gammaproteobacteria bacterium]|nr:EthD family reductase [Gammaproteobacteria bacterium]